MDSKYSFEDDTSVSKLDPHTNCGELQLKYLSLYVQSLHQISCKFKYTTLNTKQLLAKISLGSLKVH